MNADEFEQSREKLNPNSLKFLSHRQVQMIDEALTTLGDFGEVRLIIERGRLRFLVTQKSIDAHKWEPGGLLDKS